MLGMAVKSLWEGKVAPPAYLERLGLSRVTGFKDKLMQRMFASSL
jgi:hypothetical protein